MEHAQDVAVIPVDCGWSDVGSWQALWDISEKDQHDNVITDEVIAIDCHGTLIKSLNKKLIAAIGLEDIIVIDTADALLVAHRSQVEQVKAVVELLTEQGRNEHLQPSEVHRPWGSYHTVAKGSRYQVKRIHVKPNASLSLQLHHHRSEHWIIVKGTALVQIDDQQSLHTENQSVYIPIGKKHRLTNPGKMTLELIEVQSGGYLGEDDIVRFDDMYLRE